MDGEVYYILKTGGFLLLLLVGSVLAYRNTVMSSPSQSPFAVKAPAVQCRDPLLRALQSYQTRNLL